MLAEPVERDARHGDEQLAIERDLAVDDALGDRERELHHLRARSRRIMSVRSAPSSSMVCASRAQHRVGARGGGLGAGALALRVALGERVALERGDALARRRRRRRRAAAGGVDGRRCRARSRRGAAARLVGGPVERLDAVRRRTARAP